MNVFVRIINRATGSVQHVDIEAASEEEAVERFDSAIYNVRVIRPEEMQQAKLELVDHLQQQLTRDRQSARKSNHYSLLLCVAFLLFFVAMICFVIPAKTRSLLDSRDGQTMSDADKALWIELLLGD